MPKRIKQEKRPTDVNELAHHLVEVSTRENDDTPQATREQISRFMAEMGRKGGKKGGKRRLETMSAKERSRIAKKAARSRWNSKLHLT